MPLISLTSRSDKASDLAIAKKAKKRGKTTTTFKGGGIAATIANIKAMVLKNLGKYEDETLCIRDAETLHDYVSKAIEFGRVAIDTETTGLDPMLDECVGFSLYFKGAKAVYVPMNHISYITMEKCANQLDKETVAKELQRFNDAGTKIVMFNANFDIRVIYNQIGVRLHCWWDCSLASRLLNENERQEMKSKVGLKKLHRKYVLQGKEDVFAFSDLFDKKIKFNLVPINVGYLYAAHDAKITDEFYEFQAQHIYYDESEGFEARNGMNGVSYTFFNIEIPCIDAVVDMEDVGVSLDIEYAKELSVKYHEMLEDVVKRFYKLIEPYKEKIDNFRRNGAKLDDPINISSNDQLSVLLYDVIGLKPTIDAKSGEPTRGTGKSILVQYTNPVCKIILEYRGVAKLINTYIDKLPNCLNPNDHRLHGKFNQYGANTGRFSSSEPNLQNIPSKNKDIRPMFKASDGYVMMSSDYSQQEPKCLAALCCKDGDPQMYNTFMQGKDLYSEIASKAFNKSYIECLEHFPRGCPIKDIDGHWEFAFLKDSCYDVDFRTVDDFDFSKLDITLYDYDKLADGDTDVHKSGKELRTSAKSVLLGVLYGRGVASIAEQLFGITDDEEEKARFTAQAQAIKDSVFRGFPAIKEFEDNSIRMAKEIGYVTTVCGRKRRFPDMTLPPYEVEWKQGYEPEGDILDFDDLDNDVPYDKQMQYLNQLNNARSRKQINAIKQRADRENIKIVDNGFRISKDITKVVNARIQGSAADLTKLAMIKLYNNQHLRDLGFRMLIQVHDEIIAECPEANAKECSELFAKIMSEAAEAILEMPIKCDIEVSKCWYGKEVEFDYSEEEDDE